jgi:hypothetical protein
MLSEARRAWNRDRLDLVSELRCECANPSCQAWVPAVADKHRKDPGEFLVAPSHFDHGLVIRAADVFFVVELRGHETKTSEEDVRERGLTPVSLARHSDRPVS